MRMKIGNIISIWWNIWRRNNRIRSRRWMMMNWWNWRILDDDAYYQQDNEYPLEVDNNF
jgi:hypothetical protein